MTATAEPTELRIKLLPKQKAFVLSTAREVLYSGAFGAGKSYAVCVKLLARASKPGAREGLCRKHLVTLKATTLRTLLDGDGERPPVLPKGMYTHNKSDKVIKIKGGGEIVYFGLDDPSTKTTKGSKVGSMNLSGVGVDQMEELTRDDVLTLRGRIRTKVDGLMNQIYGACNPGPPSHHLAIQYGLAMGHQCKPNCEAIATESTDNIHLPSDYIEDLQTFGGLAYKRFVKGLWVGSDGLVYDRWDRNVFVQEREDATWQRIIIGQDEGYTNPAVMLVICVDGDGRLHVAREWYKTRQLESEVVDQAHEFNRRFKPEAFVLDPSAAKLRAAMRAADLNAMEANNDVFGGIQRVQRRLSMAGDDKPRLTVDPRCANLIREFESYEWENKKSADGLTDDVKDKPIKKFDHAMDALRYGIAHIDGDRDGDGPARFTVLDARDEPKSEAGFEDDEMIISLDAQEANRMRMLNDEACWSECN